MAVTGVSSSIFLPPPPASGHDWPEITPPKFSPSDWKNSAARQSPALSLLTEWAQEQGLERFKERTGLKLSQLTKSQHGLFSRLGLSGFIEIAKSCGKIPEDCTDKSALWNHPVTREIRRLLLDEGVNHGQYPSTLTLCMALEHNGIRPSAEKLRDGYGDLISWKSARELQAGGYVSPAELAGLMSHLIDARRLTPEIAGEIEDLRKTRDSEVPTARPYWDDLSAAIRGSGITPTELAEALRVQKSSSSSEPAQMVRVALRGNVISSVPPGVLACFAAKNTEELAAMLDNIREQLTLRNTRSRASVHPLKIERSLWGVEAAELKTAQPSIIKAMEWGKSPGALTSGEIDRTLKEIQELGLEKARQSLERWLSKKEVRDLRGVLESLTQGHGGVCGLAGALGISPLRMSRVLEGEEVLPLCFEGRVRELYGAKLPPEFRLTWQLQYVNAHQLGAPLGRILRSHMTDVEETPNEYFRRNGIHPTTGAVSLKRAGKIGTLENQALTKLLSGPDFSRRKADFIELVNRFGDIPRALSTWLSRLEEPAQTRWRTAYQGLLDFAEATFDKAGVVRPDSRSSLAELLERKTLGQQKGFEYSPHTKSHPVPVDRSALEAANLVSGATLSEIASGLRLSPRSRTTPAKAYERAVALAVKDPAVASFLGETAGEFRREYSATSIRKQLERGILPPAIPFGLASAFAAESEAEWNQLLDSRIRHLRRIDTQNISRAELEEQLWGNKRGESREAKREEGKVWAGGIVKQFLDQNDPGSIAATVKLAAERTPNGFIGLEGIVHVKAPRLRNMAEGQIIPSFPDYRTILKAASILPTARVLTMWHAEAASVLSRKDITPIARALDQLQLRNGKYLMFLLNDLDINRDTSRASWSFLRRGERFSPRGKERLLSSLGQLFGEGTEGFLRCCEGARTMNEALVRYRSQAHTTAPHLARPLETLIEDVRVKIAGRNPEGSLSVDDLFARKADWRTRYSGASSTYVRPEETQRELLLLGAFENMPGVSRMDIFRTFISADRQLATGR